MSEVDILAKKIWDYHLLHHPLKKVDCILSLCSNDIRVAEYAADLFKKGYAPLLAFSGGSGVLTHGLFNKPEAEVFADVAVSRGVPREKILLEPKSTNTGENIQYTKRLFEENEIPWNAFIVIQKPYMERRTYATIKKVAPEMEFIISSPPIAFDQYPNDVISKDMMINIMIGDLQRIKLYPERGFQIYQEIPADVWEAYETLAAMGYTKHLVKD